jgi:hypothetical protein
MIFVVAPTEAVGSTMLLAGASMDASDATGLALAVGAAAARNGDRTTANAT